MCNGAQKRDTSTGKIPSVDSIAAFLVPLPDLLPEAADSTVGPASGIAKRCREVDLGHDHAVGDHREADEVARYQLDLPGPRNLKSSAALPSAGSV